MGNEWSLDFALIFRQNFDILKKELSDLDLDWDLVFLGRKILKDSDEPWVPGSTMLVEVGYTYWTLAYMMSGRGAEKLMAAEPVREKMMFHTSWFFQYGGVITVDRGKAV